MIIDLIWMVVCIIISLIWHAVCQKLNQEWYEECLRIIEMLSGQAERREE